MVSMREGPVGGEPRGRWDAGLLHEPDHRRCLPCPSVFPGTPALASATAVATPYRDPPADIVWAPKQVYVTIEVTGLFREPFDIRVAKGQLTIRASDEEGMQRERVVELSEPVDSAIVHAAFRNGVVDITLTRRPRDSRGG